MRLIRNQVISLQILTVTTPSLAIDFRLRIIIPATLFEGFAFIMVLSCLSAFNTDEELRASMGIDSFSIQFSNTNQPTLLTARRTKLTAMDRWQVHRLSDRKRCQLTTAANLVLYVLGRSLTPCVILVA